MVDAKLILLSVLGMAVFGVFRFGMWCGMLPDNFTVGLTCGVAMNILTLSVLGYWNKR